MSFVVLVVVFVALFLFGYVAGRSHGRIVEAERTPYSYFCDPHGFIVRCTEPKFIAVVQTSHQHERHGMTE